MITFETGITPEAVDFVKDNLKRIGKLESITHERNIQKVYYKTDFNGIEDTMTILGGLASGFGGSGPDGLFNLLIELGVSEETARKEVYTLGESVYQFEIELRKK